MNKCLFILCALLTVTMTACKKTPDPGETTLPTVETTDPQTVPTETTVPETVPEETTEPQSLYSGWWVPQKEESVSFEEYYDEERAVNCGGWHIKDSFLSVRADEEGLCVIADSYEAVNIELYRVPNTAGLTKPGWVPSNGRRAHVIGAEEKDLVEVDLETGEQTILFSDGEVVALGMFDHDVLAFAVAKDSQMTVYRLYLPEDRLDVLYSCPMDNPVKWFRFVPVETNQEPISWTMMNPEFYPLLMATVKDPPETYMPGYQIAGAGTLPDGRPPVLLEDIESYPLCGNKD